MHCWLRPVLQFVSGECWSKYMHVYNILDTYTFIIYVWIWMDIYMGKNTYMQIYVFPIYHRHIYYAIYMWIYIYTPIIHNSVSYIPSLTKSFSSVNGNCWEAHLHYAGNLWSVFIVPHLKCLVYEWFMLEVKGASNGQPRQGWWHPPC